MSRWRVSAKCPFEALAKKDGWGMRSILASDCTQDRVLPCFRFQFFFASELAQLASGFTLLEGFKFAVVGLRRLSFADCVKL